MSDVRILLMSALATVVLVLTSASTEASPGTTTGMSVNNAGTQGNSAYAYPFISASPP